MAARKHERTRDRAFAVQVLYTGELKGESPSKLLDEGLCLVATEAAPEPVSEAAADEAPSEFGRIREGSLTDYALGLIRGVEARQAEIDERLEGASENWALSRMPIVDRSVLRLAVYEMLHCDDVPVSVSINEAVELARDFGGEEDSPRFVNGVLGRIARTLEAEAAEGDDTDAAAESAAEAAAGAPADTAPGVVLDECSEPADAAEAAADAVVGASGAAARVQGEV